MHLKIEIPKSITSLKNFSLYSRRNLIPILRTKIHYSIIRMLQIFYGTTGSLYYLLFRNVHKILQQRTKSIVISWIIIWILAPMVSVVWITKSIRILKIESELRWMKKKDLENSYLHFYGSIFFNAFQTYTKFLSHMTLKFKFQRIL